MRYNQVTGSDFHKNEIAKNWKEFFFLLKSVTFLKRCQKWWITPQLKFNPTTRVQFYDISNDDRFAEDNTDN